MRIGKFTAVLTEIAVGGDRIALWRVADLERHVDRTSLLAAEHPAEPPYWAHLWSGAIVLAAAVPAGAHNAIELGCGLGLPGLVAARRGARVTFVDRVPAALEFARASAAANRLSAVTFVGADATAGALSARFDLVLAAEMLYDRAEFSGLAAALARHLAPRGCVVFTDAGRTDTRAFYTALEAAGLRWQARETVVREEGLPVTVRLVEAVHR